MIFLKTDPLISHNSAFIREYEGNPSIKYSESVIKELKFVNFKEFNEKLLEEVFLIKMDDKISIDLNYCLSL